MASRKRGGERIRVGKVTLFLHHNAWWIYFSEGTHRVRRKVGPDQKEAEIVAAQTNLQLTQGAPTVFSFQPVSVAELRKQFLEYHEHVLKSSVGTLNRYRAATKHLEDFATWQRCVPEAHEVRPDAFASYLRQTDAPEASLRRVHQNGQTRFGHADGQVLDRGSDSWRLLAKEDCLVVPDPGGCGQAGRCGS